MNCPHHHRIFAARAAQLSRSAVAPGGIRHLLPLRAERRTLRPDARALAQHERRAHLLHRRAVRGRVQRGERHVSEVFQNLRHREISDALQHVTIPARLGQEVRQRTGALEEDRGHGARRASRFSGINYVEVPNEAAFYGPKIDVQVWSAIGREFTIATNQVDFAVPAKLRPHLPRPDNTNKTPLCIHRAPLGTHERFIGFLIEHYAGNFPLWLAPDQVRVLTISDDRGAREFRQGHSTRTSQPRRSCRARLSTDKINGKIQRAELQKIHTMLVHRKARSESNRSVCVCTAKEISARNPEPNVSPRSWPRSKSGARSLGRG